MHTILVTGSAGFIGKHLMEALGRRADVRAFGYDVGNTGEELNRALAEADVICHLAGVNRPQDPKEFQTGNAGFTGMLCDTLRTLGRTPTIVMSSSIQAALDNPYGTSKRQAEEVLEAWSRQTGGRVAIFRLKNVFGKWCRPNYNSVVATFCHNIAHDLPIAVSDPTKELELVYIDDVVGAFLAVLDECVGTKDHGPSTMDHGLQTPDSGLRTPDSLAPNSSLRAPSSELCAALRPPSSVLCSYREVPRSFKATLGQLAAQIRSFRESRRSLVLPSFEDPFTRCLYATYLSYLEASDFAYGLDIKTDNRGCLAEFMKSAQFGQIFVSRTKPGITRGNHYHHTKTEKFLVVEGEGIVRFRPMQPEDGGRRTEDGGRTSEVQGPRSMVHGPEQGVIEYRVSGRDFRVVDIPPGYTHSIENVGETEMVVLFWASEIFDPARPDTFAAIVRE